MLLPGVEDQPGEEKIIVRSNGTVTYVGKDIAYQNHPSFVKDSKGKLRQNNNEDAYSIY